VGEHGWVAAMEEETWYLSLLVTLKFLECSDEKE
jgi:hypothetical protein